MARNYAKVGKRQGRPAFRTPSSFRLRRHLKTMKTKAARKFKAK